MALPKIVFHNVTNGLTAEIILSEEIDKNAIIEIPSDDTASITDGSGNKLIKLTTHEQMKRLLNQMTSDFNDIFSAMRRELTNQFQNINTAISNEASQRLEQDRNIMNSLNTEIQNRQSGDTQLQRNIDSEASTRQSKDSDLQRQINEKVPVGTIIPVLKSLNGVKISTPSTITNNYLKCDGSIIPSSYSTLRNQLYPSTTSSSGTSVLRDRVRAISGINNCFIMNIKDFNKLLGCDFRAMVSEHMLPFGKYISINYQNDWSLSLHGYDLAAIDADLRVTWEEQSTITDNGDAHKICGVAGKDPNGYLRSSEGFLAYILWTDHGSGSRERILREEVFYMDKGYSTNTTGTESVTKYYPSYRHIDYGMKGTVFISSANSMNTESPYIGLRVALLPLSLNYAPYAAKRSYGKLYNLIEISQAIGDFHTYLSGTTLIESNRLGRFKMNIGDFSRFVNMNEKILRNNFLHYGDQLTYNLWRSRQWTGVRPDGRLMSHNYYEYYPFNASSREPFGCNGQTGSSYDVGTNVRKGYATLIRIYNTDTNEIEKEIIYISYDSTTNYASSDYGVIGRYYPTFEIDNNVDEICLHDSYDFAQTERTLYAYRLPLTHLFTAVPEYKEVTKVTSFSMPYGLDRNMLNYWRIKYNYEYTGGDTSISGIEYNPYGGVGRIALNADDYYRFAYYFYSYQNSAGKKRFAIRRLIKNNSVDSRTYTISSSYKFTRYQYRVSGDSNINIYYYSTDGTWRTYQHSIGSSLARRYIFQVYLQVSNLSSSIKDITAQKMIVDLRNNNSSSSNVSNNSWCIGILQRYYPNLTNPPYTTNDFVILDQTFADPKYGTFRIDMMCTVGSTVYGRHHETVEVPTNELRLPNLNEERMMLSGGENIGSFVNTNVVTRNMSGDLVNIEKFPYHSDETIRYITVEFWIKF